MHLASDAIRRILRHPAVEAVAPNAKCLPSFGNSSGIGPCGILSAASAPVCEEDLPVRAGDAGYTQFLAGTTLRDYPGGPVIERFNTAAVGYDGVLRRSAGPKNT